MFPHRDYRKPTNRFETHSVASRCAPSLEYERWIQSVLRSEGTLLASQHLHIPMRSVDLGAVAWRAGGKAGRRAPFPNVAIALNRVGESTINTPSALSKRLAGSERGIRYLDRLPRPVGNKRLNSKCNGNDKGDETSGLL